MADLTRRLVRHVADVAGFIGTCPVAILCGAAYGCVGYYIALAVGVTGAPGWPVVTWLMAWVAVGAVVLTVWTIRWTGVGADWFQTGQLGDNPRRVDTHALEGATPWP